MEKESRWRFWQVWPIPKYRRSLLLLEQSCKRSMNKFSYHESTPMIKTRITVVQWIYIINNKIVIPCLSTEYRIIKNIINIYVCIWIWYQWCSILSLWSMNIKIISMQHRLQSSISDLPLLPNSSYPDDVFRWSQATQSLSGRDWWLTRESNRTFHPRVSNRGLDGLIEHLVIGTPKVC